MAKKVAIEDRIVQYFTDESEEKIEVLFNIVRGIMVRRKPPVVRRKSSKSKAKKDEKVKDGAKEETKDAEEIFLPLARAQGE